MNKTEVQVQCCKGGKRRQGRQWVHVTPTRNEGPVSHGYCPSCAREILIQAYGTTDGFGLPDQGIGDAVQG